VALGAARPTTQEATLQVDLTQFAKGLKAQYGGSTAAPSIRS
jgi:hypothetical protein